MTIVVADISVSLDGFVTGPDAGPDNGLGTGGEPLHTWVLESDDPLDAEILATSTERSGAVVMGRNLFDVIDAPSGWSDDMGYGAQHAARPPFFVVTTSRRPTCASGSTSASCPTCPLPSSRPRPWPATRTCS
jgi:dihydrofolate reductase